LRVSVLVEGSPGNVANKSTEDSEKILTSVQKVRQIRGKQDAGWTNGDFSTVIGSFTDLVEKVVTEQQPEGGEEGRK
jgi:hypothetical protein